MAPYDEKTKAAVLQPVVFDVDTRTGFLPAEEPLQRLPSGWVAWEFLLDEAIKKRLAPGDKVGLTGEEAAQSARWRASARKMPLLATAPLLKDDKPAVSRRAHLVLAFLLSFYIQTLPPTEPVVIPRSISIPILQVSKFIGMPPVVTYADCVLYNWTAPNLHQSSSCSCPDSPKAQALSTFTVCSCAKLLSENIRSQSLFTGLEDEEVFYLTSAKIELRGVEALDIMRSTMDEIFVNDTIAVSRITGLLSRLCVIIGELKELLMDCRKGCDPDRYYNDVRPFFRGEDATHVERKWVFQGIEEYPDLLNSDVTKELSGASAGQSSLIYALDVFLGVGDTRTSTFMSKMQKYMPRNHRLFLEHLSSNTRPLRPWVMERQDGEMGKEMAEAYNKSVMALKDFRDSHMIIASLYILGPARRARDRLLSPEQKEEMKSKVTKGTGGTDLVKFLKGARDQTAETVVPTA
ncbi:Indoleamine 2,3-dioxygenase [Marasmius fiardii PR-910]|nr:Indoleamine 2,3-dioxygenase [Marasmius fiardii PR-910]